MLSGIENQVNTLLSCDSADESQKRNAIIKVTEPKVFLLDQLLGCEMIRGSLIEFLDSCLDRNTIGECKWLILLSKQLLKRRSLQQVLFVGRTDSSPLV